MLVACCQGNGQSPDRHSLVLAHVYSPEATADSRQGFSVFPQALPSSPRTTGSVAERLRAWPWGPIPNLLSQLCGVGQDWTFLSLGFLICKVEIGLVSLLRRLED